MNLSLFSAVILLVAGVTVAQEPKLEITPSSLSKAVGSNSYVSCVANVPDKELAVEMKWIDPRGNVIESNNDRISATVAELGSLDLYMNQMELQDGGKYTCQAVYAGNIKLEEVIDVELFTDIDFGDTQKVQTPIIGTDAKIHCGVTSIPKSKVDWMKDGVAIESGENVIVQSDGILIKNIDESYEGVYRCRARVQKFGLMKFMDLQVEVHVPPKITGPPEDVNGVEKEAVNFQCVAEGKPSPTYRWVDGENRPLQDREGYSINDATGQLTIMDLRPEQAGEYRCTASNPAGDDTATATLKVLTKPKIESFVNQTHVVKTTAELRCVASGDPKPLIIFKKESNPEFFEEYNDDERITVKQSVDDQNRAVGILQIDDLQRSDDGLYSCSAESDGGKSEGWGHITVEFPPTFEDQIINEFWSWEQEKVNLSCTATSIPNATIQWYMANEEIPRTDENLQVLALGPTGILQVNPVSPAYFVTYTCKASNTHGTAEYDLTLKQAHRPGPISNSQIKKKTATTIEWGIMPPVDNGGRQITGYKFEYRTSEEPWDNSRSGFWPKGGEYIVEGLNPLTKYVFRFAARNEVGDGEFGGEREIETPEVTYPEEPMIFGVQQDVVNPSPYSSHFELMWKVPLDNGSPIRAFQITYFMVTENDGSFEQRGKKTVDLVEYPGDTKFDIEGLRSETIYKIELRAKNNKGYSRPAEALIRTASGVDEPDVVKGGLGVGIITTIIVISLLVLVILLDISCFFAKNAGVTATVVGMVGDTKNAKDKEAMLEDGMTNEKTETKTDEEKVPLKLDDEKPKESEPTEPTETTPMIEEGKNSDKDAIITEEKAALDEGKTNEVETKTESKDSPV